MSLVTVNGERTEVADGTTIAALLGRLDVPDRGVAVAVDAEVVPRGAWATQPIPDGARIEVLVAVQGG